MQIPNYNMGINYNSPTVQNTLNYSPPPTFGTIGGLGYNGGVNPYLSNCMNGGYYSGYYNYNPQEIMRQMEEQRKAQETAVQNQIDIQKMKAKIFGAHSNVQIDEEFLDRYYDPRTYSEIQKTSACLCTYYPLPCGFLAAVFYQRNICKRQFLQKKRKPYTDKLHLCQPFCRL